MTERLYSADPYLLAFEARVVARREHEGRPAVILDRTAFYAESGGQPWDTGTLGDARVVAVIEDGPDVLHVLDRPLAGERVQGRVDAQRRRDHMQQHHGQHLLSRAFVVAAQAETVAFHLGGGPGMSPAAGLAVEACGLDDADAAQHALGRLDARRACLIGAQNGHVDGAGRPHDVVGVRLGRPGDVLAVEAVQVDRGVGAAEVKGHGLGLSHLDEGPGQQVLAVMLLHVVAPALRVDPAVH
ncbi:MAG: alanine--tRNA ligase-related protein, partial [Burkholderiales bacterium]